MAGEQLDAIIGFPNQSHWDQFQADIRYLTHIGGHQTEVAMVFPLAGEPTAFVRGSNEIEWWRIAQDWIADIRPSRREWSPPLKLLEPSRRIRIKSQFLVATISVVPGRVLGMLP